MTEPLNQDALPDVLDAESPDARAIPLAAIAGPKFCSQCGSAWQPDWSACAACVARYRAPLPVLGGQPGRSLGTSLALYFTWLAVSISTGIAGTLSSANSVQIEFIYGAISATMVIVWCVVARHDVLPALKKIPPLRWFVFALVASIATYTVASGALWLMRSALKIPSLHYTPVFFRHGYGWPTIILCVCVQPAIFEELAFRGVIFAGLRKILSGWETVIVSSLMFMILHLSVPSFPHLLLIGLMLGYLRYKTGSMFPGMLLHFCHNLLCVLSERWHGWLPWS